MRRRPTAGAGGPRARRVGLLGGSFNPAHEGHRHISLLALKQLGLDEIWWLVSPQNPLKPAAGMAGFDARLARARAVARHPRITVSDLERRLGCVYTAATLRALTIRYPRILFVWIMGADNLAQIPRWKDWRAIFRLVPVAVFDRPSYSYTALASRAARRFARYRLDPRRAGALARLAPPAWVFVRGRLHAASATEIRAGRSAGGHASL
ncbi:MAG: nicotinate-nucleotide adenylyltransferase [Alphaproteobacteria bacterium]